MAVNMKDFLAKKRAQKAVLTKLKQKLSEQNLSLGELELLRTKFKNLQDEFNSIFDSIINLTDEINVEKIMDEQFEINAIIIDLEFDVCIKLSKFNQNKVESSVNCVSEHSVARLPKISLPAFAGEMYTWLSFKDIFKASIDQNSNFSDAVKL
ncbi:uncharacterized protein NPIL_185761 [Nephila pilipes]|uniref:Uncharacterized protein n=1 Tax=Nephila pilipes TaxID=299642 RepID=A0A8X6QMV2_NEPPI|nr:uncharacterized protein NPIL_185761 [Nephila pilipes]